MKSKLGVLFICFFILWCFISCGIIVYQTLKLGNEKVVGHKALTRFRKNRASHPMENSCKYPVLNDKDETIKDYIFHPRLINCTKVQNNFVKFDEDNSKIFINQTLAEIILGVQIVCYSRPISGTLKPHPTKLEYVKNWTKITEQNLIVKDDQFEVICYPKNDIRQKQPVFSWAFAQILRQPNKVYSKNTDSRLSIDLIAFDSTSWNQFRRHMPNSLAYMTKKMGFFFLEGYNKVADNSIVNFLPTLTGKRYIDATYKNHKFPSDLPENVTLDMESIPFIWKDFAAKNCPTLFNDDVMHYSRGLFHYPWAVAKGFKVKPTDYFFRPWHIWHRKKNSSGFCFGNFPQPKLQLDITKRMMKVFKDECHFSFTFFTEVSHDTPSNLELLDDYISQFLETYHKKNYFNHTVLIIMGDHGNRISALQYQYIGRIEERMPLFGIYFPKWFRKLHSDLMENLKFNKNRLTSNYDVYKTLKDIVDERFDSWAPNEPSSESKGQSLFTKISSNRNCMEANIPDNHCTCLEFVQNINSSNELYKRSLSVIFKFTQNAFEKFALCQTVTKVVIIGPISIYTTNELVKHGVRGFSEAEMKKLEEKFDNQVEYIEATYRMDPIEVLAKIRLQHNKKLNKVFVNSGPLVLSQIIHDFCSHLKDVPDFCVC